MKSTAEIRAQEQAIADAQADQREEEKAAARKDRAGNRSGAQLHLQRAIYYAERAERLRKELLSGAW